MKQALSRLFLAAATAAALTSAGAAEGLDEVPQDIRDRVYSQDMMDPAQPLGESAYRDWKPKNGPPWTIGYASSYAGNTWRARVMDRLQNDDHPEVEGARTPRRT